MGPPESEAFQGTYPPFTRLNVLCPPDLGVFMKALPTCLVLAVPIACFCLPSALADPTDPLPAPQFATTQRAETSAVWWFDRAAENCITVMKDVLAPESA